MPSLQGVPLQILAATAATMSVFDSGIVLGWPSPVLASITKPGAYPLQVNEDESSWIASIASVGAMFAPFLAAAIVDIIGRKMTLLATALFFVVSWIMLYFGQSVALMYSGRFVCGIGYGLCFSVIPVYLGEIGEPKIRGSLGAMFQLMLNFGTLAVYCYGPYVTYQWNCVISGLFVILFVLIFFWMPETPYFYLLKKKHKDAEKSLRKLRSKKRIDDISNEMQEMKSMVETELVNKQSLKEILFQLFFVKSTRRALIIVVGIFFFQQFSGIMFILSYATLIFDRAGGFLDSDLSAIVVASIQVVSSFVSTLFIDRWGRKPLLYVSLFGSCVSHFLIGIYFLLSFLKHDVSNINWLPLLGVILYLISFNLGLGPVPWAVIGEVFPTNVKGTASCISSFLAALYASLVIKLFQVVADGLGTYVSFLFCCAICLCGLVFCRFVVIETKNKTFNEIRQFFET